MAALKADALPDCAILANCDGQDSNLRIPAKRTPKARAVGQAWLPSRNCHGAGSNRRIPSGARRTLAAFGHALGVAQWARTDSNGHFVLWRHASCH